MIHNRTKNITLKGFQSQHLCNFQTSASISDFSIFLTVKLESSHVLSKTMRSQTTENEALTPNVNLLLQDQRCPSCSSGQKIPSKLFCDSNTDFCLFCLLKSWARDFKVFLILEGHRNTTRDTVWTDCKGYKNFNVNCIYAWNIVSLHIT